MHEPDGAPIGPQHFSTAGWVPFAENSSNKGGPRKNHVELTVEYPVPIIADVTNRATHSEIRDGECTALEMIYERGQLLRGYFPFSLPCSKIDLGRLSKS